MSEKVCDKKITSFVIITDNVKLISYYKLVLGKLKLCRDSLIRTYTETIYYSYREKKTYQHLVRIYKSTD